MRSSPVRYGRPPQIDHDMSISSLLLDSSFDRLRGAQFNLSARQQTDLTMILLTTVCQSDGIRRARSVGA
jgi:hypothetical protein